MASGRAESCRSTVVRVGRIAPLARERSHVILVRRFNRGPLLIRNANRGPQQFRMAVKMVSGPFLTSLLFPGWDRGWGFLWVWLRHQCLCLDPASLF